MNREKLIRDCERLADVFKAGRTGQFVHWQLYIEGERLALGFANIVGYADHPKLVTLEISRLLNILALLSPDIESKEGFTRYTRVKT